MSNITLRLGELLSGAGLVEPSRLEEALTRQASSHTPLGEVLITMGLLARDELPAVLAVQEGLRRGAGDLAERLRIGRLLIDAGAVDEATLARALDSSRASGRRLGETLVELGAISATLLQRILERQRRLAAVALAGLALLAAAPNEAHASDQQRLQVQATVRAHASIDRQELPQAVVVSSQDVARGFVDLDSPVHVGIRTNHAAGVVLAFSSNSDEIQGVSVREAHGAELRDARLFVPATARGLREHVVSLKLRLRLAPHSAPGTIVHPLTLFLAPG